MKKGILFTLMMIILNLAHTQVSLKTMVTQGPVVAGESFQVQYVLEDDTPEVDFYQPDFRQFRVISGPNTYGGTAYGDNGPVKVKNITFTLVAIKEGTYVVPGASVRARGQLFRSLPASLQVISRTAAIARGILAEKNTYSEGTYLAPGEDPVEKMRKNIFMKVSVDRKTCYVGQPVTATFKLYSRLNSRSDIVKNPGFYGFAIQEMIGLADHVTETEVVNGKKFEVHTVRKVQLYPLREGTFTIDPMEVQNKVEFSTSTVQKKTEQEIVEGVIPDEDELFSKPGFKLGETSMRTDPVSVKVNALPDTNKPASFNGATGKFNVSAALEKEDIGVNKEGDLIITVSGKGNFIQLAAPAINWPSGMEGFAPEIKDSLSKSSSPLEGKRVFRFRFVSARPGAYVIPSISFSFFDPDSNRYRSISTKPVPVTVTNASATEIDTGAATVTASRNLPVTVWIGIALAACAVAAGIFIIQHRRTGKSRQKAVPVVAQEKLPTISELLQPPSILINADESVFYSALRRAVWDFITQRFGLSGSAMNKRSLQEKLDQNNIAAADQLALMSVLDACEAGMFTGATGTADQRQMLDEARSIMKRIAANE